MTATEQATWMEGAVQRGAAKLRLEELGREVDGVYLVFPAEDSDVYLGGQRRDAVFYVDTKGRAMTAVMCGDGYVHVKDGW